HAHVGLGPHPLGVPRVAHLEDLLEPLDARLAVPPGTHLEHLVVVAEHEEVEQPVVPQASEVALGVDEVDEPLGAAPRLDPGPAHRARQGRSTAPAEDDVRASLLDGPPGPEELHAGTLPAAHGARLAGCPPPSSPRRPRCSCPAWQDAARCSPRCARPRSPRAASSSRSVPRASSSLPLRPRIARRPRTSCARALSDWASPSTPSGGPRRAGSRAAPRTSPRRRTVRTRASRPRSACDCSPRPV